MASSDLSVLLDMGFEKERAELAVKKTGGCKYSLRTFVPVHVYSMLIMYLLQYKEPSSG